MFLYIILQMGTVCTAFHVHSLKSSAISVVSKERKKQVSFNKKKELARLRFLNFKKRHKKRQASKLADAKYNKSEKRAKTAIVYESSTGGRTTRSAYEKSEKRKELRLAYNMSEGSRIHEKSDLRKSRKHDYDKSENRKKWRCTRYHGAGLEITYSDDSSESSDHVDPYLFSRDKDSLHRMDPSDGGDDSGGQDDSSTESSDSADNHIFQDDDVEDVDAYGRAGIGCAGDMFKACKYCGALKLLPFKKPFPSLGEVNIHGMCCNKGSISIDEESPSPGAEFILNLWSSDDKEGKVFRKYSRKINNAFSLASYLATEADVGNFSPSYKVRGNAYVAVGALFPGRDDLPCFSQMYVYDPDDEVELLELRMNQLQLGVDVSNEERRILERLMKNIEVNLRACNPYVKQFIMAKDREVPETKHLIFHPEVPTGNHVRTYNAPTHELMVCATDDLQLSYPPLVLKRDTTYCDHNQNIPELQLVHDCHPMYDLIRFLFFFPDGGGEIYASYYSPELFC